MIKLRAWDNDCKVIRDYDELKGLTLDALNASNFELEHFTGVEDVNGKDIYEGDIIEYCDQYYEDSMQGAIVRETGYIGSVVKNNGAFGILISRVVYTDTSNHYYNSKDFVPFYSFEDPESDTDLKGNVHDNPELLEVSND